MRAFLRAAPGDGAGYGILEIYDLGEGSAARVIITRKSDGKTLAPGGWRSGKHDILPRGIEWDNGVVLLDFGPEVIDDLTSSDDYELEIPGVGNAAIIKAGVEQSRIIDENGAGAWPPPPDEIQPDATAERQTIYEGVEQTPLNPSSTDINNLPSGVAAIPDAEPDNKKKRGCMLLASAAFVLWAGIAWVLWHWAINTPMPPEDEKAAPFELMPRAEGS